MHQITRVEFTCFISGIWLLSGCFASHESEEPPEPLSTVKCVYVDPDEEDGDPCVRGGYEVKAPEEMLQEERPPDARNMYCMRRTSGQGPLVNCRDRLIKGSIPPGYRACTREEDIILFSNLFACEDPK